MTWGCLVLVLNGVHEQIYTENAWRSTRIERNTQPLRSQRTRTEPRGFCFVARAHGQHELHVFSSFGDLSMGSMGSSSRLFSGKYVSPLAACSPVGFVVLLIFLLFGVWAAIWLAVAMKRGASLGGWVITEIEAILRTSERRFNVKPTASTVDFFCAWLHIDSSNRARVTRRPGVFLAIGA